MGSRGQHSEDRGRRAARIPAILLIVVGVALMAAAVSLGKGGPSISAVQFAVDSSGTGPPPTPPAPPAGNSTPQLIADLPVGFMKTQSKRPVFTFGSNESNVTFYCKMGNRQAKPCASPFRVPNLGYGRHVLWVMVADAAGKGSPGVKFKYHVVKPPR